MENTKIDFWKMVFENEIQTIVLFNTKRKEVKICYDKITSLIYLIDIIPCKFQYVDKKLSIYFACIAIFTIHSEYKKCDETIFFLIFRAINVMEILKNRLLLFSLNTSFYNLPSEGE